MKKTKAVIDKEVRMAGEVLIDLSELTATSGNTYVGSTEVDGVERFFEIKIVAKSVEFTQEDVNAILEERKVVEANKIARAEASSKKKAKDEKRRADAKAKALAEK